MTIIEPTTRAVLQVIFNGPNVWSLLQVALDWYAHHPDMFLDDMVIGCDDDGAYLTLYVSKEQQT